jgi:hypothetical protein
VTGDFLDHCHRVDPAQFQKVRRNLPLRDVDFALQALDLGIVVRLAMRDEFIVAIENLRKIAAATMQRLEILSPSYS